MSLNIFLTPSEKDAIRKWEYKVEDRSIISKLMNPFWNRLVTLMPTTVAPNIISFVGLLCVVYAYYLTSKYTEHSFWIALASSLLIFDAEVTDIFAFTCEATCSEFLTDVATELAADA